MATLLRCVLVMLLALGLRFAAESRQTASRKSDTDAAVSLQQVRRLQLNAADVRPPTGDGLQEIVDDNGNSLGHVCQTLPAAQKVVGYRGPSNVALLLDEDLTVTKAELLFSDDTPDHVAAVERDEDFFQQFRGWTLGDSSTFTEVDATTGATLTALAIAEGIAVRLGSEKPSLRFPDGLNEEDVTAIYGPDHGLTLVAVNNEQARVQNSDGQLVGRLIRTGPLVDSIAGYQGPTELLIATDAENVVTSVRLRRTFDNEPYAGYLNEDDYFWKVFLDRRFSELSGIDLVAEQVEGVSGATMTSLAVAETVVAAATEFQRRRQEEANQRQRQSIHWSRHDTGTVIVLMLAIVVGTTRLRGLRWIQVLWLLMLVAYFGLVTGNLISLAVLTGWAANGIAWKLAPGLFAVVAISVLLPPLTKRNLYCTHICPHGAAQQLLRRLPVKHWKPRVKLLSYLTWLPGILLTAAVLVTLLLGAGNLSSWEPFNAWIWYVAGAGSIVFAMLSLAASIVIPMAYCRFGCPTGRLLDYLRHSARATRVTMADAVVVGVTVVAWLYAR